MLSVGQTIERYTVEAFIGQGGMAMVYRVRHNHLGSLHALKILTVPRPNIRERLLQEGRVQAGLRHPNVVAVNDVLEIDGAPGLLMEYVDGPSLEQWLAENHASVSDAAALFRGICSGVGEAHHHGLVHRDLKPANVLLACTSTGVVPKVTDFGIAKLLAPDEIQNRTGTHVAMGTPCYMAPEQIRDARGVDQRADIFSLGCLLYELVCGVRPFDGPDVLAILNAVASGSYIPPRERIPELPQPVVDAIEQALLVDRDKRLQSCRDVLRVVGGSEGSEGRAVPLSAKAREPSEVPQLTATLPEGELQPPAATAVPGREPGVDSEDGDDATRVLQDPDDDADGSGDTASIPIDPNAATVPSVLQRVASPSHPGHKVSRDLLGQGWFGAMIGGVGGLVAIVLIVMLRGPAGPRIAPGTEEEPAVIEARADQALGEPVAEPEIEAEPGAEEPGADGAEEEEEAPSNDVPARRRKQSPHKGGGFLFSSTPPGSPPPMGRIIVSGDYSKVELIAESGKVERPGEVPGGRYTVEVLFADGTRPAPIPAVMAEPGRTIIVQCYSDDRVCKVR